MSVPVWDSNGHLGLLGKLDPVNAAIYIGTGGGSLTDAPGSNGSAPMGIKVKINSVSGETPPDGGHINVNLVDGTGESEAIGWVSRVDVRDTTATKPAVGLWGDAIAHTPTRRPVFGANLYARSNPSAEGMKGPLLGVEIGAHNNTTEPNHGAAVSVTCNSQSDVRSGLFLRSAKHLPGTFEYGILARSNLGAAPRKAFIHYGPTKTQNVPSGPPLFAVETDGSVTIGGITLSARPASNGNELVASTPAGEHVIAVLP